MERKTPRFDYLPEDPTTHTRDAFRNGYVSKKRRVAKVKYWAVTGNRADRRALAALCPWPSMDWNAMPPPLPDAANVLRHAGASMGTDADTPRSTR